MTARQILPEVSENEKKEEKKRFQVCRIGVLVRTGESHAGICNKSLRERAERGMG